jgi:hypothetical protein
MTKKLEELFNLPSTDATAEESQHVIEENREIITEVDLAIDKIDAALPTVRDLETGDTELDELAQLAQSKAEDLIDLGMNVEPRFSGVILQTAGVMLGQAKAKLDHQIKKDTKDPVEEAIDGQGVVLDRNELLKQILNKKV